MRGVETRRAGARGWTATVAATAAIVLALGLVVLAVPTPAGADVTSISPSSREVDPGASASATVTVEWPGQTCVSAQPSTEALAPSFSRVCSDEPRWTTVLTVHAPQEPGTYSVTVTDDRSNVSKTFTLRVRPPQPPPTEPTTTVAPTTTARPTTTTAPTTTTVPTTTTAPPATTPTTVVETTTTVPLLEDPFTSLTELVEQPVPSEGVFLPLVGDGFRDCLPLTEPCGDPGSGLVLVPARTAEITWEPLPEDRRPPPRTDLRGVAPLRPVGVAPPDPRSRNYALTILDLTAPGGQARTLFRGMDEQGGLGVVTAEQPVLRPVVGAGTAPTGDGPTSVASMPFGRPTLRTASSFTEAAPALPVFASADPQVLYALRPDNGWGLNLDLLPLLGDSVPLLVRAIEGPPGLFIPRPPNLRVPQDDSTTQADSADDAGDGDGGGASPVALLGGAVGLGVVLTAAAGIVRRRRAG